MAEISTTPVARNPREYAVVDAEDVNFAWTPVDGAESYRLQIARDRAFANLIFNSTVGDRTETHVSGVLPQDGNTLYWRVQARTADDWEPFSQPVPFRSVSDKRVLETMGVSQEDVVGRSTAAGTTSMVEFWAFVIAILFSVGLIIAVALYNLTTF